MNYISDVHDYFPEETEVVKEFLSPARKKQLRAEIQQIVDEEFDRLEEFADQFISQVAARRSMEFLERVLKGDRDAAMSLLGDRPDGISRCRTNGVPWARMDYGTVFTTDMVRLRQRIVAAHPEMIRDQRILDLESIVEGLKNQISALRVELNSR